MPDGEPSRRQLLRPLELRPQECGRHFARQVGGPGVDPCVLVHLTAKEAGSVGALLLNDLRSLHEPGLVNEQRATFPAVHVLCLME
jgi:hypothetical protein